MFKLERRIIESGRVIGYEVINEQNQLSRISKDGAWKLAKDEQLYNVKALSDGSLSGINGFEIKSLPKRDDNNGIVERRKGTKFSYQDLSASFIRKVLRTEDISAVSLDRQERLNYMKEALKDDVYHNVFCNDGFTDNRNTLSDNIEVVGILNDEMMGNRVAGYIIRNVGDKDIECIRIENRDLNSKITVTLKSGDELCISRSELTLLACRPEIGLKLKNGKVISSHWDFTSPLGCLGSYYFAEDDSYVNRNNSIQRYELKDKVNENDLKLYFRTDTKIVKQFREERKERKERKEENIFNMFNRK